MENIPPRMMEIIEDFQLSQGREKLELLLQYAENFPDLPVWLRSSHDSMDQVHECMTPVFVHTTIEDRKMIFFFDIPPSSPTVRGFASLLRDGLNHQTPQDILNVPSDFYLQMGLDQVLTHQRLNGLQAILAHMKRLALQHIEE
jgi:cysteine desulfuration protein SufE